MGRVFNYVRAASALAHSVYHENKHTCQVYGVSMTTLDNWKKRLKNDEKLEREFNKRLNAGNKQWLIEAEVTMDMAQRKLQEIILSINSEELNVQEAKIVLDIARELKEQLITADIVKAELSARGLSSGLPQKDKLPNRPDIFLLPEDGGEIDGDIISE